MKKLMLPIFFLFGIVQFAIAQESTVGLENKNEIKFNALYAFGGYFELAYERTLGKKWAAGLAGGAQIIDSESAYNVDVVPHDKLVANPYFRYYFGKKLQSGFFLEANTIMNEGKRVFDGAGMAMGIKFAIKNTWNIDLVAGGGYLLEESNNDGPDASGYGNFFDGGSFYQRLGINLGYRF